MIFRWSAQWWRSKLPIALLGYTALFLFLLKTFYFDNPFELSGVGSLGEDGHHHSQSHQDGDGVDEERKLNDGVARPVGMWDYEEYLRQGKDKTPKNVTILMWTTYYHNKDLTDHIRNESPIPSWCNVTFDRSALQDANAIVFHTTGTDTNLNDLPKRSPLIPWVYYTIEPPLHMSRDPKPFNGLFNRTMTYRLDSDYPCPYGYLMTREKPLPSNPYLTDPAIGRGQRNQLVAWMVSHCSTTSQREKIVDGLKKYFPIDVYGSCGTKKCAMSSKEGEADCYRQLGLKYKFYLSFENSLCLDYITEKFSNALKYNLVPIVYGGGNYTKILPYPKSFIDVQDFKTVKELAEYIQYLDKNDTAYAEYFQWKQYYTVEIRQGFAGFRRMCYALQKPQTAFTYHNI